MSSHLNLPVQGISFFYGAYGEYISFSALTTMHNTVELRRSLRQSRKQLSPSQRQKYNCAINQRFIRSGLLLRASSIATFLPNDGEVDLSLLIQTCAARRIAHFLPVIKKNNQLNFSRYKWGDQLSLNQFGIPEPVNAASLSSALFTIIVLPLVGFDLSGNRLGMGGGYYDKTLAFVNQSNCFKRPLLIGAAYEVQLSKKIQANKWDVGLDAVITEHRVIAFSKRAKAQLITATRNTINNESLL